jgi:hypothetical protein
VIVCMRNGCDCMHEKSITVYCELKKLQQGLIIFYFTVVIGMWVMQGILGRRFWDLVSSSLYVRVSRRNYK